VDRSKNILNGVQMNELRKYLITFHGNLPGSLPSPVYPGYSVELNVRNKHYANSGYIFTDKTDAETWAETRVLPDKYWEINWKHFPGENSYIYRYKSGPL
jgi:hypothetical protein